MEKFISNEMEKMGMEERIWQFREDLPGDVLLSAKLVKAAFEENFDEVEKLLSQGADPRICRRGDAFGVESALYYALKAKRFDIAEKLYNAGDRLDDLVTENDEPLDPVIMDFLAFVIADGTNYFYDATKPLSECCRCSNFKRIKELMPTADKEELRKAFINTVWEGIRYFKNLEVYEKILEDLLAYGAKISEEDKNKLNDALERRFFERTPRMLHPNEEILIKFQEIIEFAC